MIVQRRQHVFTSICDRVMSSRRTAAKVALEKIWEIDSAASEDEEIPLDEDFEPLSPTEDDEHLLLDVECANNDFEDNDDNLQCSRPIGYLVTWLKDWSHCTVGTPIHAQPPIQDSMKSSLACSSKRSVIGQHSLISTSL